ncbi:MAG: 3-dehydroquinate synthase, partial [Ruminiclostridium sp.]|nr:3-dehydroquinate synthase [Ruminiclostridium sp.]
RGIPFINYATTLLAAADASVGGKTAVDTPLATNLIGIFNQPEKVYIDISTWKTLPQRQISSGLAETIKHACISSRKFFDYIMTNIDAVFEINDMICQNIAQENCKIKYQVIMKDERESGLREILNLGHTVGRAIETVSEYQLLHGEALSIGLVAEIKLSKKLGYCTDEDETLLIEILDKANLPVKIPDYIDREELVKKLYTDKKVKNGELRFVLQKGIGAVMVFDGDQYAKAIPENMAREIIMTM